MQSRPKSVSPTTDKSAIAKATIKSPVRLAAEISAGAPDYGILITPPDPADLDLGALNTITPPPGFTGRAVLFPPGSVPNVDPNQYTFVAYIAGALGPTSVYVPSNAQGLLFADLPNGVLPPKAAAGLTLFDAISSAIQHQVGPPPPDGTGNGFPHD